MKKKLSPKNLLNSFKYAIEGYLATFKNERNMKIHSIMTIIVIILGIILKVNQYEWIILILAIGLVTAAEILNTSIENLVDLVTSDYHQKAKTTKDTAAAFVLILSITSASLGLIIFIPKIINLIGG